jgi:hypothetical protein
MSVKFSPCKGCTERSTACWDRCPKDARGEYGYKAWKAEYQKVQAAEKEYKRRSREDWLRGDLKTEMQKKVTNKNGKVVTANVRK